MRAMGVLCGAVSGALVMLMLVSVFNRCDRNESLTRARTADASRAYVECQTLIGQETELLVKVGDEMTELRAENSRLREEVRQLRLENLCRDQMVSTTKDGRSR